MKEIRKLSAEIEATKNDLSKVEEHLEKCQEYKRFLDGLTPRDWIVKQRTLVRESRIKNSLPVEPGPVTSDLLVLCSLHQVCKGVCDSVLTSTCNNQKYKLKNTK